MLLISGAMMTAIYYLSIWFQAVQDQSAMHAGIRTIPLILSFVLMGILSAMFTQKLGYYMPAMLLCPCLCAIGGGMLSTLTPISGSNQWIGYQIIFGLGIGCGFQTSMLVPQTVLSQADVPLGMALMFLMQQLGGSVFVSVGQNLFAGRLLDESSRIAGIDPRVVINAGATALREVVPSDDLSAVIKAYNHALTRVFILAAALSACALLAAGLIEWRSIRKQTIEQTGAVEGKDGEKAMQEGV